MSALAHAAKSLLLQDFVAAFFLSMRQLVSPKETVNYPNEKGPLSLAMVIVVAGVLHFAGIAPK